MHQPDTPHPSRADPDVWAQRQRNNARLGWVFGAVALILFFLALWQYRPL
jgi:hypothetical protein